MPSYQGIIFYSIVGGDHNLVGHIRNARVGFNGDEDTVAHLINNLCAKHNISMKKYKVEIAKEDAPSDTFLKLNDPIVNYMSVNVTITQRKARDLEELGSETTNHITQLVTEKEEHSLFEDAPKEVTVVDSSRDLERLTTVASVKLPLQLKMPPVGLDTSTHCVLCRLPFVQKPAVPLIKDEHSGADVVESSCCLTVTCKLCYEYAQELLGSSTICPICGGSSQSCQEEHEDVMTSWFKDEVKSEQNKENRTAGAKAAREVNDLCSPILSVGEESSPPVKNTRKD